ncbi:MAG: ribonuclease P [Methanoregula sp.]|nr:ribonuclease P [Methanoregula sp.]
MSVRPPTLREKRRYIIARIDPAETAIEAKDLYYAMYEAVVSLFGDVAAAAMQPSVLAIEKGYGLFRCTRGSEREFAIALSTLSACRDCPVALRVFAISGTVESLRERIAALEEKKKRQPGQPVPEPGTGQSQEPIPSYPQSSAPVMTEPDHPGSPDPGPATAENTEYRFGTIPVEPVAWHGHKVDVIEKGFKNTHRLFLTTEDLEILHATTIPDGL